MTSFALSPRLALSRGTLIGVAALSGVVALWSAFALSTRAIEEFGVRLKIGTHILLPGARHEILHETDAIRQRFWAAFDAYLGVTEAAA